MNPLVERKLAAILSADAVGYTRLMADDEEATVRTITAYRARIAQRVREHRGRVVDAPGDNLLAELPSALDAIRCALAVQTDLVAQNADLAAERRMFFRIGVHVGDVVVDGERIYGDGVNVAARLEGLAEPGGVCCTAAVFEQVRGKIDPGFVDLGERELKNVPHPVRVYAVKLEPAATVATEPRGAAAARERPAIAVLPFDDLSADPELSYLAEAIAADLIPLLGAWRAFPVIARSSSFSYPRGAIDLKRVARELGARYVVTGDVRAAGGRVRVSAALVDATTLHNVWTARYDRKLEQIFGLQDEVTEAIVSALQPELRRAEAERARRAAPESLEAWALTNRAWLELQSDVSNVAKAREILPRLDQALASEPDYALAHAVRAFALALIGPGQPDVDWKEAILAPLRRATTLAPEDPQIWQLQGAVMGNLGRTHDGIRAFERCLELDPNNAQARAGLGISMIFAHGAAAGLAHIDRARQLSPRDPLSYNWLAFRALGCLVLARYDEALADARASVERTPTRTGWMVVTVSLSALGRSAEAQAARDEWDRVAPGISLAQIEPLIAGLADDDAHRERMLATLRRAGF